MEAATYKLRVRVGDAEFDAEGPEETVRDQFDLFMNCLSGRLPPKVVESRQTRDAAHAPENGDQIPRLPPPGVGASPSLTEQVFITEANGDVSLRFLSKSGHEDALLLLIYGIRTIKGESHVGAVELGKAARQSGITLARFTDALSRLAQYVQKGGQKRGTRYLLNNQGALKAEGIMKEMVTGERAGELEG